jgi:hypothetical protein
MPSAMTRSPLCGMWTSGTHRTVKPSRPDADLDRMKPDLDELRTELEQLLASWEYAFAMGHGCSVGDHPSHRAVRQRVADLRARIAEHTP